MQLIIAYSHDFTGLCLDWCCKCRENLRNLLMNPDSHIQNEIAECVWSLVFFFVLFLCKQQQMVEGDQEQWESRKKVKIAPSYLLLGLLSMNSGEKAIVEDQAWLSQSQKAAWHPALLVAPYKGQGNVEKSLITKASYIKEVAWVFCALISSHAYWRNGRIPYKWMELIKGFTSVTEIEREIILEGLTELIRMLVNICEGKIYKNVHWLFKEAYLVFKILLVSSTYVTWSSMLAILQSPEHRLVLALGPWHLLFHLLEMHLSWSFKWLSLTHYSGFNSDGTASRKPCLR